MGRVDMRRGEWVLADRVDMRQSGRMGMGQEIPHIHDL